MHVEEIVKTTLENIHGLHGRVFPVEALKNAQAPFVFYLSEAETEEDALDGPTGLLAAEIEVHCVAASYGALVGLCRSVRSRLRALTGTTHGGTLIERAVVRQVTPDLRETEVNLFRRAYALQLDYQEVNENE